MSSVNWSPNQSAEELFPELRQHFCQARSGTSTPTFASGTPNFTNLNLPPDLNVLHVTPDSIALQEKIDVHDLKAVIRRAPLSLEDDLRRMRTSAADFQDVDSDFGLKDDLPFAYLNKAQEYVLEITCGNTQLACDSVFESILAVGFHMPVHQAQAKYLWEFWANTVSEKISKELDEVGDEESTEMELVHRALEYVPHLSVGVREITPPHLTLDLTNQRVVFCFAHFKWLSGPGAKVGFRINCLSTDFSINKGVQGFPLRLFLFTQRFNVNSMGQRIDYYLACRLKVFRDKGAERKARDEQRRWVQRVGCNPPEELLRSANLQPQMNLENFGSFSQVIKEFTVNLDETTPPGSTNIPMVPPTPVSGINMLPSQTQVRPSEQNTNQRCFLVVDKDRIRDPHFILQPVHHVFPDTMLPLLYCGQAIVKRLPPQHQFAISIYTPRTSSSNLHLALMRQICHESLHFWQLHLPIFLLVWRQQQQQQQQSQNQAPLMAINEEQLLLFLNERCWFRMEALTVFSASGDFHILVLMND